MAQGMSEEEAYAKTATETAIRAPVSIRRAWQQTSSPRPTKCSMQALRTRQPVSGSANTRQSTASCCATRRTSKEVTGIIYESWHYRFVRQDPRQTDEGSGLCLEEYLQQELPGELHRSKRSV